MNSSLTMLKRAVPLACASLFVAAAAQAALQDRDLNGDTVVDAFYDSDLDITWLRDANVNGVMDWDTAVAWADGYNFGGYSDWRLPTTSPCPWGWCDGAGEMGHLWSVELGNKVGVLTNTGAFQNLRPDYYWSGADDLVGPYYAWFFSMKYGGGSAAEKGYTFFAMAVHPGDVGVPIPEPDTYALMLAGLVGLALARRRRQR